MDHHAWVVPVLLALAAGTLLPGCSQVVATSDRLVGAPTFPPTNPATVQILRQFPDRSYQRIGEVFIEPQSGNPPEPKIEQALQKEGARMGADAVVIVVDRVARSGAFISGPVDGGTITPQYGHLVRAVAIKYGTAAPAPSPAQQ
jgi:hypothetical protein